MHRPLRVDPLDHQMAGAPRPVPFERPRLWRLVASRLPSDDGRRTTLPVYPWRVCFEGPEVIPEARSSTAYVLTGEDLADGTAASPNPDATEGG